MTGTITPTTTPPGSGSVPQLAFATPAVADNSIPIPVPPLTPTGQSTLAPAGTPDLLTFSASDTTLMFGAQPATGANSTTTTSSVPTPVQQLAQQPDTSAPALSLTPFQQALAALSEEGRAEFAAKTQAFRLMPGACEALKNGLAEKEQHFNGLSAQEQLQAAPNMELLRGLVAELDRESSQTQATPTVPDNSTTTNTAPAAPAVPQPLPSQQQISAPSVPAAPGVPDNSTTTTTTTTAPAAPQPLPSQQQTSAPSVPAAPAVPDNSTTTTTPPATIDLNALLAAQLSLDPSPAPTQAPSQPVPTPVTPDLNSLLAAQLNLQPSAPSVSAAPAPDADLNSFFTQFDQQLNAPSVSAAPAVPDNSTTTTTSTGADLNSFFTQFDQQLNAPSVPAAPAPDESLSRLLAQFNLQPSGPSVQAAPAPDESLSSFFTQFDQQLNAPSVPAAPAPDESLSRLLAQLNIQPSAPSVPAAPALLDILLAQLSPQASAAPVVSNNPTTPIRDLRDRVQAFLAEGKNLMKEVPESYQSSIAHLRDVFKNPSISEAICEIGKVLTIKTKLTQPAPGAVGIRYQIDDDLFGWQGNVRSLEDENRTPELRRRTFVIGVPPDAVNERISFRFFLVTKEGDTIPEIAGAHSVDLAPQGPHARAKIKSIQFAQRV